MIIITAADAKFYRGLVNLIGSLHFWAPNRRILVYDLGLNRAMISEVSRWRNTTLVSGILDRLPAELRDLLLYAWKPIAIRDALSRENCVLHLDAGSDVRGPVDTIEKMIMEDGHFLATGQDTDMTRMSHPAMYTALGTESSHFAGLGHFAGGVQGYRVDSQAHHKILQPMTDMAQVQACIAPSGSSLNNHRYDQSLLSILAYRSGISIDPKTFLLASSRDQLSDDPLVESERVIYTARRNSSEYMHQFVDHDGQHLYRGRLIRARIKFGLV